MRRLTTGFLGVLLAAAPLAAQTWQAGFGVLGGIARIKPAGSGLRDQTDLIGVPGEGFLFGAGSYGSMFAVIPVGGRFAIEPSFAATELMYGGTNIVGTRLGARLDYAVTPHVYAGLGFEMGYTALSSGSSEHVNPLYLQAGVGYRFPVTGRLAGRVEARWAASRATHGSGSYQPAEDVYALLVGVSSPLEGRPARDARAATAEGFWAPALGLAGGYFSDHGVGSGTVVGLSLPGNSNAAAGFIGSLPTPPSLFALIPVKGRLALEPGLNIDRSQLFGGVFRTFTGLVLSVRADYAVGRAWYAGLGPVVNYFRATGAPGAAQAGITAAWGYRFHVAGDLGGRVEASYSLFAHQHVLSLPPVNVLGLGAGVTMGI